MGKRNSKHAVKELDPGLISQLVGETRLSEAEIVESYRKFMSDYPEGKMTCEQLKESYEGFFPDGDAGDFAEFVFRTYDTNGDGSIDFQEFITALSVTRRGSVPQKLEWLFSMYDLKSNGSISKAELLLVLKSIYKMIGDTGVLPEDESTPEKSVEKMFMQMDKDGDGVISLSEFIEGVKSHPTLEALVQSPQGYLTKNVIRGSVKK